MTSGSRTRRAAGGVAALTIAALAGCHGGVQVARIATAPNRPQSVLATAGRAALLPATVALDTPSEMSSIEPSASAIGSTEPAPALARHSAESAPAPTPLLDAALVRSKVISDIVVNEMAGPADLPTVARQPATEARPAAVEPPEPPRVSARDPVPPDPLRPEEIWRDEIRQLVTLARSRREQPGGDAGTWNLRARVLDWLAEPEIDPDLGQREPDGVRAVLRALGDPATPSRTRGDELRTAVEVLEDKAPLELTELRLCSRVETFGDYEPYDPPVRKAGQSVVVYSEVDGLRHESTSAGFRTRLSGQVEIVSEDGGALVLALPYGPAEEVCRRRRRDYFVPYRLVLPRTIPPGNYRLRLILKDLLADRTASREVAFAIIRD